MSDARTCEHVNSASQVGCMSCFINLAKQVEREQARADRYQAEFAACKALLIAEQKRAERAEAERSAAEARAEQWALREAALVEAGIRREAEWLNEHQELTRRASEARALALLEAADYVAGRFWVATVSPQFIAERIRALAALPVEPARRQVTENANALGAPDPELPPCVKFEPHPLGIYADEGPK